METWREELYHSAKGTHWKKHKYVKKVGNKYYYKEDLDKAKNASKLAASSNKKTANINAHYGFDKALYAESIGSKNDLQTAMSYYHREGSDRLRKNLGQSYKAYTQNEQVNKMYRDKAVQTRQQALANSSQARKDYIADKKAQKMDNKTAARKNNASSGSATPKSTAAYTKLKLNAISSSAISKGKKLVSKVISNVKKKIGRK